MAKKQVAEDRSRLFERNLEEVLHAAMIPYSEHIILDRAIPRVEDGLKPVQRRILYTLHDLGITPDKPYKKSARVVGECLGKYHPHGDTSVYDAMVRMAQDFSMRMPLVDGHGNFGSADGDSAAAMRYTEVRMSNLALQLLRDLDKDTVRWSWNFDDTVKEPDVLPGRFPNLLVNGTMGIAIGLSSNIPTHNLGEVIDGVIALIDRPKITLEEMMKIIPGPDFPTGGIIITEDTLRQAYETGRGRILMKADIHIEALGDKKNIVITELPYQVRMSDVLKKIVELRESKKEIYGGISDIVDESDRTGIRAVIKVRREVDAEKLGALLLKNTDLQKYFPINMVAIADGKPRQLSLLEILRYYLEHQVNIIVGRTRFDLKNARHRAEIVKGLLVAIKNIDEVIKIIKKSPSQPQAKLTLRERFGLSEDQAQAILDMRLRALTGLEVGKLEDELKELEIKIDRYVNILASKKEQYAIIKSELAEIKRANKSPRRSIIKETDDEVAAPIKSDEIEYKELVLVQNLGGMVKAVSPKNFSMSDTAISSAGREELSPAAFFTSNKETLYAFSNLGNCYKIPVSSLAEKKWRDRGQKLAELTDAEANERIVGLFSSEFEPAAGELLFITKNGMVKRTLWSECALQKSSYRVINLADDEVFAVETVSKPYLLEITKGGIYLAFSMDEIPVQGRNASGVKSIALNPDDELLFAGQMDDESDLVLLSSQGKGKKLYSGTLDISRSRALKGSKIFDLSSGGRLVFAGLIKEPAAVAAYIGGDIYEISTEQIPVDARNTGGRTVLKHEIEGAVIHASTAVRK